MTVGSQVGGLLGLGPHVDVAPLDGVVAVDHALHLRAVESLKQEMIHSLPYMYSKLRAYLDFVTQPCDIGHTPRQFDHF